MKGNAEESLRKALAEFADETSLSTASEQVHLRLRQELRAKSHRRRAVAGFAAAAALAAILFGVTLRWGSPAAQPAVQATAREAAGQTASPAPVQSSAAAAPGVHTSAAPAAAGSVRRKGRRPTAAPGNWRRGDVVLTPWYFNTALPPSARSVMVRSEVDAHTAMRFGVTPVGSTAPVEILFGEDGLPRAMRFVRRLPTRQD